jgi:hypothetical protein
VASEEASASHIFGVYKPGTYVFCFESKSSTLSKIHVVRAKQIIPPKIQRKF